MKIHIVQKGDTLWKISQKYGVDFEELKKLNSQLSNPDMIMPGMKIKIPSGNVHVKKEAKANANANISPIKETVIKEAQVKKEEVKAEHPYKDLSPQPLPVMDVEETLPKKDLDNNLPPKAPYVPKMPTQVDVDIHNWNFAPEINMPPAPANILPGMMKPEVDEVESVEDVAPPKMPEMPKFPEAAPQMPVAPATDVNDPYCQPITPVMPGAGFDCYPPQGAPFPAPPVGEGYAPVAPAQGFQPNIPVEYDEDDIDLPPAPPWNPGMPANGAPFIPAPYGGYAPSQVAGAQYQGYPEPSPADEMGFDGDDYPYAPQGASVGYQPAPFPQGAPIGYQPLPAPAPYPIQGMGPGIPTTAGGKDCGCGGPKPVSTPQTLPAQVPGFGAPVHGYPGAMPGMGMPQAPGYPGAMPGMGMPQAPGYPGAMPGMGMPQAPGYPGAMPGMGMPQAPGYQGAMPGMGTPQAPGYPGAMPGMGMPQAPGYPGAMPGYGMPANGVNPFDPTRGMFEYPDFDDEDDD
ncbi:SafA/ExsA family spore coat assembly protein [Bacillus sp. PS06]|uniref:SafA/ExsA family spore coat assembly protein n=1 Tax=Bacillus sp. PS06 TaxID=2764176 RepID=UPI0017868AF7|nr:SafA/ExsA family spore coat assembly protein [Bacillus sp. PS06]MBD8069333.1 SafA/ExsA family spore coat assembly protein [Bacillus sp. PS06]